MSNNLSIIEYKTKQGNEISLDMVSVAKYMVCGEGQVSDKEFVAFAKMCEAHQLNPFTKEAYLIKYGSQPAQMVVNYEVYEKLAESSPEYLEKKCGIIVQRNQDIIKKQGACLYPGETLIGGWCEAFKVKSGQRVSEYKEVSMNEYNMGKSTWKDKPCTMIVKVAIAQCLRAAFKQECQGLYIEEENVPLVADYEVSKEQTLIETPEEDKLINREMQKELFAKAKEVLGDEANVFLHASLEEFGIDTSSKLTVGQFEQIMTELEALETSREQAEETITEGETENE